MGNIVNTAIESQTKKVLINVGIGIGVTVIGYFVLARPLLIKFNIIDDKNDRLAKRFFEQASQEGFFSPIYYKQNESRITLKTINAQEIAKNIRKAWGFINDDEELVYVNMMFIKTKEDLSFVSYWYSQQSGSSLLDDLKNKLSSKEFLRIKSIYDNIQ